MTLHERLSALAFSPIPTWVFDVDCLCQRWANQAALELWRASTPEEFYARDFSDMSEAAQWRMRGHLDDFRSGRAAEETWTLYPKGVPVTMRLMMTGVTLDDGRTGVLIQGLVNDETPSPDILRSIEALRHTSVMVTLLTMDESIILQNPASQRALGRKVPLRGPFSDATVDALLSAARTGEMFCFEGPVHTEAGERWHAVEARTLTDPTTGETVILVHQTDETARRRAERRAEEERRLAEELRETLALVQRQKRQIAALSAPVLEVAPGTIALPIIGTLDAERAAELASRTLAAVSSRRAKSVILDLTGADAITADTAEQVARLGRAIRLLGARPIATGITPALAVTLVHANADLGGVLLLRSLREGIEAAKTTTTPIPH